MNKIDLIDQKIYFIRGMRIMLDSDLAQLYGVNTKRLNEQVKRNKHRFPKDFIFQLTLEEGKFIRSQNSTGTEQYPLRSQNATLKRGRHIKYAPYAFTEHGAVMLASVLNSHIAVQTSVEIVRAFVRLRTILSAHKELARKLEDLERKYDNQFKDIFVAIRKLMQPPYKPSTPIGFRVKEKQRAYIIKT